MGASKKKNNHDGVGQDDSEESDLRREGVEAQLFSRPVDNIGFNPRQPQPPAYIKMRSKYKKVKEFDRVFLAQELLGLSSGKRRMSVQSSASSVSGGKPIWALEFSKDGKYLAAGGQDKVVRVWSVISSAEDRRAHEQEEEKDANPHLSAPVFQNKAYREFHGHTSTILDLSWSKNNFLLSSSMDKTVRLWHLSKPGMCLCTFKHTDFVPSVQFHPRDDRFFLAGSLDMRLRLWSIPDKSIAFSAQLPEMITAVSFTPDGKTSIAGTLNGLCHFFDTDGLKAQTQIHVRSNRGKNTKGSKITGIQTFSMPPGNDDGEVKVLISSNDSRIRMYNVRDKNLELKFKGHENSFSQIRASVSDDFKYVMCGSEDRKAYIFSTTSTEGDKRTQLPVEMFEANSSATTAAIIAPTQTKQLLSSSEDPIYDICNPPPVTLVSRAESMISSHARSETGSVAPTPAEGTFKRAEESPAYLERNKHWDGNILVTADYAGCIKVFRQDCAFQRRRNDFLETSSLISRRVNSMRSGRPLSIATRNSGRSRRDSIGTQPPNDRIMSWRQDIAMNQSSDNLVLRAANRDKNRSVSPHKSIGTTYSTSSLAKGPLDGSSQSTSRANEPLISINHSTPALPPPSQLGVQGSALHLKSASDSQIVPSIACNEDDEDDEKDQPSTFYDTSSHPTTTAMPEDQSSFQQHLRPRPPNYRSQGSVVSALSSELSLEEDLGGGGGGGGGGSASEGPRDQTADELKCKKCGGLSFQARFWDSGATHRVVCTRCGKEVTSH